MAPEFELAAKQKRFIVLLVKFHDFFPPSEIN